MFRRWLISLFIVISAACCIWFFRDSQNKAPYVSTALPVIKSYDRKISSNSKICLNMIVKNESKVIRRCLDSVIPHIDSWIIVDTGSDDGTQKIIKQHLKNIPGQLHERPWKNFEENRNEALKLAQAYCKDDNDYYILFMDADDILEFDANFQSLQLTKDLYNMWRGTKSFTYTKPQLAKADLPWKWVGVTHEYLGCDQSFTEEILENVRYITISDGASSEDTRKFYKNIDLLEAGLKKEPNNSRYVFYLAESYRAAGEKGKAIEWYQKAVEMNGWGEEVFWSKLQIGHHLRYLNLPINTVIESYKDAHRYRPHRIEPIYHLAEIYNQQRQYDQAYAAIKMWESIPKPAQKDALFNEDWMNQYGLLFQLSICSYYLGKYQESLETCDKLLELQDLPKNIRTQAESNRAYPLEKIQALSKPTKRSKKG